MCDIDKQLETLRFNINTLCENFTALESYINNTKLKCPEVGASDEAHLEAICGLRSSEQLELLDKAVLEVWGELLSLCLENPDVLSGDDLVLYNKSIEIYKGSPLGIKATDRLTAFTTMLAVIRALL